MPLDRRKKIFPSVFGGAVGIVWLLRDDFTDTRAAGSVNGTPATPGPGTRTVTDTDNLFPVGSGYIYQTALGGSNPANPGLWYADVPVDLDSASGNVLLAQIISNTGGYNQIGTDTNTTGNIVNGIYQADAGVSSYTNGAIEENILTLANTTTYNFAFVFGSGKRYTFVKGGAFSDWTLLVTRGNYTKGVQYPAFISTIATARVTSKLTFMRVPQNTFSITPLMYDSFTRADGALGSSETTGPDGQDVTALAWSDDVGTWAVSSNKAACSALSGGVGVATIPITSSEQYHSALVTRSGGDAGIVVRWIDSSNYVRAIHNGTNVQLVKVVSGVPTTLIDTAKAYSAGAELVVRAIGTKFRVFYNRALIGSEQTISDAVLQNGVVGLYTTNTGNTFDDAQTFPTTAIQYEELDNYIVT